MTVGGDLGNYTGVPQSGLLGPLIFTLYMDDLSGSMPGDTLVMTMLLYLLAKIVHLYTQK